MTWFAIRTSTRAEAFAVTALTEAGLIGYAPKHIRAVVRVVRLRGRIIERKVIITKPLLAGYVFAELPTDEAIHFALSIRGVQGIVSHDGKPQRIPPLAIGALILADACHAFDETWEPPRIKGRRYSHRWKPGDRVQLSHGAGAGHVGTVVKAKGKNWMRVLLTLFGRPWEVETEHRNLVKPDERIAA